MARNGKTMKAKLGCRRELVRAFNGNALRYSFVEQPLGGRDQRLGVEEILDTTIAQQIAGGEEDHSLVMGHPRADQFVAFSIPDVGGAEVGGFIKTKRTQPAH